VGRFARVQNLFEPERRAAALPPVYPLPADPRLWVFTSSWFYGALLPDAASALGNSVRWTRAAAALVGEPRSGGSRIQDVKSATTFSGFSLTAPTGVPRMNI